MLKFHISSKTEELLQPIKYHNLINSTTRSVGDAERKHIHFRLEPKISALGSTTIGWKSLRESSWEKQLAPNLSHPKGHPQVEESNNLIATSSILMPSMLMRLQSEPFRKPLLNKNIYLQTSPVSLPLSFGFPQVASIGWKRSTHFSFISLARCRTASGKVVSKRARAMVLFRKSTK